MTNHVTPETAKKLKEAGFLQPAPEPGQVWYDATGAAHVVGLRMDGRLHFIALSTGHIRWISEGKEAGFIYAPTASDILRELGELSALLYENNRFIVGGLNIHGEFIGGIPQLTDNPAEACAEAWLAQSAKQ